MVNKVQPEGENGNSFFGPTEALKTFHYQQVYLLRHTLSNVLTLFAILLSFVTLVVLISENMFNRMAISTNAQTSDQFWTPYEQSCKLSIGGFIPNSCGVEVRNSTTPRAWKTIGLILAEQWAHEIAQAQILYVTTCIIGGTSKVGWASLQILAGYQDFPNCLPVNGPQKVACLAMLETTVRDTHVEGLYFLTLYADLNPSMQIIVNNVNSDGTTARLLSNPFRILVSMDGQRVVDNLGKNYIVHSYPLGPRYQVTAFCWTVIEELSDFISSLNGWSEGKYSKHPVVLGWNCGHEVKNSSELIAFQLIAFITTCSLLSGDIYISITGIKNLICQRPVMTYRILDGLERRKWLTGMITLNAVSSLLYLDVARIYYFTQNGYKIWLLSVSMISTFLSMGFVLLLSCIEFIPVPATFRRSCLCYSTSLFLYLAAITINLTFGSSQYFIEKAYNNIYTTNPSLMLWLRGQFWPSGAYQPLGTTSVIVIFQYHLLVTLGGSFGVSVVATAIYRRLNRESVLLSTNWCFKNGFLSRANPPILLTSIPLDEISRVEHNDHIVCHPSVLLHLGFATIASINEANELGRRTTSRYDVFVISIYSLIPALLLCKVCLLTPRILGFISNGKFTSTQDTFLDRNCNYCYVEGTHVH